jgi:hypothetical protein
MLTESGKAKLGDFGISGEVKDYTKHHTAIGMSFDSNFLSSLI